MDTYELAWAAGFFDGEGHVSWRPGSGWQFSVHQVDRRVLERFQAVLGFGKISGPYQPKNLRHNPQYHYELTSLEKSQAAVAMLWKWLSPVKREQARFALVANKTAVHTRPLRHSSVCVHGHDLDEENTYMYKDRRHCRACRAKRSSDAYRAKRGFPLGANE